MTGERRESPRSSEISVGDALPPFALPVTSTVIVAGAIDFVYGLIRFLGG